MGLDHSGSSSVFSNLINDLSTLKSAPSSRNIICSYVWYGKCLRICKIPNFFNTRYDNHLDHYSFQGKVIEELQARIRRIHLIVYAHAARRTKQKPFLEFWGRTLPYRAPSVVAMTGSFDERDFQDAKQIFKTKNVIYSDAVLKDGYDRVEMLADLSLNILDFMNENEFNQATKTTEFAKMDQWYKIYLESHMYLAERFEKIRSDIVQLQEKVLSDPVEVSNLERTGLLAYLLEHFNDNSSVMRSVVAEYMHNNKRLEGTKSAEAAKLLDMIEAACKNSGSEVLEIQVKLSQANRAVQVNNEIKQWWTRKTVDEFCNTAPRQS